VLGAAALKVKLALKAD